MLSLRCCYTTLYIVMLPTSKCASAILPPGQLVSSFSGVSWGVHSVRLHPGGLRGAPKRRGEKERSKERERKKGKEKGRRRRREGKGKKICKKKEKREEIKRK